MRTACAPLLALSLTAACASSLPPAAPGGFPPEAPPAEVEIAAPDEAPQSDALAAAPAAPAAPDEARPDEVAPRRAAPAASPAASREVAGTLVGRAGDHLTVDADSAPPPAGAKGTLSKRFEQQIGPIRATGWLTIAEVTVQRVDGRRIVLTLTEEKSIVMVNGKKVNHFEPGAEVKLDIAP